MNKHSKSTTLISLRQNLLIFALFLLSGSGLLAQGNIATDGATVLIDFDNTTTGILNGTFLANGIATTPASGQLDMDGVHINDDIPGAADVAATFGAGGSTNFNFQSTHNGGTGAGGKYAFDVDPGGGVNRALGFQPTGSQWGDKDADDGHIVFKFVNNSGVTLTAFRINYKIYEFNNAGRNSVIESYLTTDVATPSYGTLRHSHTTPAAADLSPTWVNAASVSYDVIAGVSVPNGGCIFLRFYIFDGPDGADVRDEFAIDDIQIQGASTPGGLGTSCSAPFASCMNATVQLNAAGSGTLTTSQVDNSSSVDVNCSPINLSVSPNSFGCGDVGPNTVTLTVTDNASNSATCTATVTVEDNVAPTPQCKDATVQLNALGNGLLFISQMDDGSSDACGVDSTAVNPRIFGCSDVGSHTVTLRVWDAEGNSADCTATATVEDNVAPDAQCKNATVQLNSFGNGLLSSSQVDNGSSDACGVDSTAVNPRIFGCTDLGPHTVTLTVWDAAGNSADCTATATVEDPLNSCAVCDISSFLTKTDENSPGANDGTITVTAFCTGTCGTLQYSLNGGPPQSSNMFTGLAPGTYTVETSNVGVATCSDVQTITINKAVYVLVATSRDMEFDQSIAHFGGLGVMDPNDEVEVEDGAMVVAPGTFVKAAEINIDNSSSVTTAIEMPADPMLPAFRYNNTNPPHDWNIRVEEGETVILTESIYEDIEIEEGATVIFSGQKDVYIEDFDIDDNVTIIFNQCTNVMVSGEMDMGKDNRFNTGYSMRVAVFVKKDITVRNRSHVNGILYSKDLLTIKQGTATSPTIMRGLFIGKEVRAKEYGAYWAIDFDPVCPMPLQAPEEDVAVAEEQAWAPVPADANESGQASDILTQPSNETVQMPLEQAVHICSKKH